MFDLEHLSLFTGFAGIDIAAEMAGWNTVGQCEYADYPYELLCRRFPHVSKWRDIRDVTGASFYEKTGLRTVKLITGGFPCQPFSTAGNQKGKDDDRYLWPEMFRVIQELKPTWVVGENVTGIINMALEDICSQMESEGFEVQPVTIPACAVGANHRRERVFIIAYSNNNRCNSREHNRERGQIYNKLHRYNTETFKERKELQFIPGKICSDVPNTTGERLEGTEFFGAFAGDRKFLKSFTTDCDWWESEPGMVRVANGISAQVDRIKGLGNAVVPQQVYPILQAIVDIERGCISG